ncbi:hypothetical protein GUITHDRAFT_151503, partial [Guillardia theta CCMP2712]
MSLKVALDKLGYKTYHMIEIIEHNSHHLDLWIELAELHSQGKPYKHVIHTIFENYTAAVDFPAAAWWKEILETFPNSKVILSTRDPERWYNSAKETIFQALWHHRILGLFVPLSRKFTVMVPSLWDKVLGK